MTIESDEADLTRVGPGTVMGEFMRRYWIPAAMSSELAADGSPMRLVLLGERLIAFRDSSGRVGVMDHHCPHRCASLFIGRNEEDGIRCIYHGWKYDVTGACVDMPSVPVHQQFKDKVHAKAYKVAERNGLIWVYMGDPATMPALPDIEAALLPEDEVAVNFVLRDCNFMQAMEGDIDTSHFGFLHVGAIQPEDVNEDGPIYHTVLERAPEYHVTDSPWGTTYGVFRNSGKPDQTYWRFAHFLFPFWTQIPQGDFPGFVHARAWVPMDDTHTMFINMVWKRINRSTGLPLKDGRPIPGALRPFPYLPNTTDWYGRWRLSDNEANDWAIDREAMRTGQNFSGISNIHLQDQAVTESMGPITDHAFEHLAPSDLMIARTRRRLLAAARALRERGTAPPGTSDPAVYLGARSGFFLAPKSVDWQQAYAEQVANAIRPVTLKAAE
jgi:phenylpropionate dioxygenase-like ring-hydroxylating dioxygenase large terminal subunit